MSNLQPSTTETITATGYVANKKSYTIYIGDYQELTRERQ
ncbi:hypothetical protein ACIVBQ_000561 [Tenacibaculum discolor]